MTAPPQAAAFLERLKGYERIEPFPHSRKPVKLVGVRWLLERLGHPDSALRVAHVAGTNGKGMTSAMLAALLHAAGRRVGLYTSPHVVEMRERIVLDGALIGWDALAAAGQRVLDAADAGRSRIDFSYFDILTALGLLAFRDAGCDWAVLETGLGGLSDATNAVDKELAVITRIDFDHMYVLGHSLREIAEQKLGIVRPAVPTVLAEQEPELGAWLAGRIEALGSPLLRAAAWRVDLPVPPERIVRVRWPDGEIAAADLSTACLTRVKAVCAANALCAAERVLGPAQGAERAARARTALATDLPGRLERRTRQRIRGSAATLDSLVLDGGHNAGALAALADELERWGIGSYTLLIGLQADKLVDEVRPSLARLLSRARRVLILAPQTARAPSAEELAAFLRSTQPAGGAAPIEVQADPRAALLAASGTPDRPLIAAGSFWMLGDLMRLLEPA